MAMTTYPRIAKECANAYREKTGETELVKAQELPTLIENMKAAELPNGKVWKQSNITSGNFTAVAYGKGIYVATGANGIYWSEDGKTWTQSELSTSSNMVYYGNGVWVAAAEDCVYYSLDGKTWMPSALRYKGNIIHYGNGVWVLNIYFGGSSGGGEGGSTKTGLYWSVDGKAWTQSNITVGDIKVIFYTNGIWCAGGDTGIYYSEDGKTWTQSNIISGAFKAIYCGNGIWYAGSDTDIYFSGDGKTWTQTNSISGNVLSIFYANGIWISSIENKGLYYSTDGMSWKTCDLSNTSVPNIPIFCLNYSNGIYTAGTFGAGLYYSIDGKTWIESNRPPSGSGRFSQIIHANDKFIAVGTSGLYYSETFLPDAPIGGGLS